MHFSSHRFGAVRFTLSSTSVSPSTGTFIDLSWHTLAPKCREISLEIRRVNWLINVHFEHKWLYNYLSECLSVCLCIFNNLTMSSSKNSDNKDGEDVEEEINPRPNYDKARQIKLGTKHVYVREIYSKRQLRRQRRGRVALRLNRQRQRGVWVLFIHMYALLRLSQFAKYTHTARALLVARHTHIHIVCMFLYYKVGRTRQINEIVTC